MRSRFLALSVLAVLAAPAANATVVYDTINTPSAGGTQDGASDGLTYLTNSFQVAGGFNSITVSLLLAAATPGDGNSLSVYLVADDNSGSSGVAGLPSWSISHHLIGTIADSSLGTSPSVATVSAVLTSPASTNNEYWLEVVLGNSSADWYGSAPGDGVGIAGQSAGWGTAQSDLGVYYPGGLASGISPISATGSYGAEISVPEPATVGLLGVGLAYLGTLRRRKRA